MNPEPNNNMAPAAVLIAVLQYGPAILPLIGQITTWIKDGKTEVTPQDIQELIAYGAKNSAAYLAEAKAGVPLYPLAAPKP